jgi:hypothetical protein
MPFSAFPRIARPPALRLQYITVHTAHLIQSLSKMGRENCSDDAPQGVPDRGVNARLANLLRPPTAAGSFEKSIVSQR